MGSVVAKKMIEKVAEDLVDSIWRQIGYVWNYNTNIQDLNSKVVQLKALREEKQHQMKEAADRGELIENWVINWLKSADEAIEVSENIVKKTMAETNGCFIGCNPNWKTRYLLSRKAKKEALPAIDELKENKFERIAYRVDVQELPFIKAYEVLDSRLEVLNEVVAALKDSDVDLIGVYGLGGVGKTTLVKQLTAKVKEEGIYRVVATANVTQNPESNKIQQEIGEWLGLKFEVESTEVRGRLLCARLKQEEKVLLILDDIWGKIELENIGIPYGKEHKGCKILMTSRDLHVLKKMEVQRHFLLPLLQEEEAWRLFQKKAGDVKVAGLETTAIEVAKRCGGLPVLIVAVATTLRNQELYVWKDALKDLKTVDGKGIVAQGFKALELSYNYLGREEKSLFLLCGKLRAHSLPISGLLRYSMGLCLFNNRNTVKESRNRLLKVVNNLKGSCLLLEGDDDGVVKMHDVVHNFARKIAYKDRHVYVVANDIEVENDTKMDEWPEKGKFEQCSAISLLDCKNVPKLPEVLECPNLQSFILYNDDSSLKIPNNFLSKLKKLTLVDMSDAHLSPMPSSFQCLDNLQTLCLDRCILEGISVIGELRKLKVLSLIGSNIGCLPREVGKLTRLQLLDLSGCRRLEEIPSGILSRLTKLQELHIDESFVKWEIEEHNGERKNANLSELKLLKDLFTLDLHVTNAQMLPQDLFSERLEIFRILIGDEWDWSGMCNTSRTLKLMLNPNLQLERVKVLLKKAVDLYLKDLNGVTCLLDELDGEGFPQLKHLHVQNSDQIQYLVDQMKMGCRVTAFPDLESLVVDNLCSLEKIYYGQIMEGSFRKLRKLKVGNCNVLKNLFPLSIFRELLLLEEINVNGCKIMDEIVSEDDGTDSKDEVIELKQLRLLTLEFMPQLKSFCNHSKLLKISPSMSAKMVELPTASTSSTEITYEAEGSKTFYQLFCKKIQFPSMKELKLSLINLEKIWPSKLKEVSPFIQNLTSLIVEGCENLSCIFTSTVVKGLAQLKHLEIGNCNLVEEMIVAEGSQENVEERSKILIPRLEFMKLKGLPMLKRFCTTNLFECPFLKLLWVENCPLLQTFISTPIIRDLQVNNATEPRSSSLFNEKVLFPNLEELHITQMPKLKMIWHDELRGDSFCKLKVLRIKHGSNLLKIFSHQLLGRFQNVEEMVVENCELLEDVFDIQAVLKVQEPIQVAGTNQLREMILIDLPNLKHVWNMDPDGILSFCNLRIVQVCSCPSLKSLFPFSIAQGLQQLEMLFVERCGVEELIGTEKKERVKTNIYPKFEFRRLKTLTLWILEELRCFYSLDHTLECPSLENLTVYVCQKLNTFTFKSEASEGAGMEKQQRPLGQPLFSQSQIVGNLRKLEGLKYKDVRSMVEGQFPIKLFHNLKTLDVDCSDYASPDFSIFHLLQKFKNLEELSLGDGFFKELFPRGVNDRDAALLRQIQSLKLDCLPNMRHLWNEDFHLLQNLRTLQIRYCHGLINLAPSSASFQNVTTLNVRDCNGLLNLVSVSAAQNMVNLTNLSVKKCPVVTEIVANDGDESQREIVFNKLETLILDNLRDLTSFCSSTSCFIKFPSLEQVIVSKCPKIKVFSQGRLSAPKLDKVFLTEETDNWRWIGDLNSTIKHLFRELIGFNGLENVRLSEFPRLQEAWHCQFRVNFFSNLSRLVVDECSLPSISIPSNLLPLLNNLQKLEVKNCSAVEQVFGVERPNAGGVVGYLSKLEELYLIDLPSLRLLWNEFPKGNFDFRNLKILEICTCSRLRYVFTPTMCLALVQLQKLAVKSCDMMEEIITDGFEKEKVVIFPLMKSMTLDYLPSLINFRSGSDVVQCPSLEDVTISDCPISFTSAFLGETQPNASRGSINPKVSFPNMKKLKLSSVNIERIIWHTQTLEVSSIIRNLTTLIVGGCSNLKYLLSSSMVKSVLHLKVIEIRNCKMMKQVIVTERLEDEIMSRLLFNELNALKLEDLPRLERFCTGNTIECPALEQLRIGNCPKLKTFISNSASSEIATHCETEKLNSALFDDKVEFPNLTLLELFKMSGLKIIWGNKLPEGSFCKLETLMVENAKQLQNVFPANLVSRFQSLKWLCIDGSDALQEVFDLGELKSGRKTHAVAATKLETLEISNLSNLKYVWNEDPQGILEFQNLSKVDAYECPSLKCLFPASIATNVVHLKDLVIVACGIEEIVGEAEDGLEDGAKFEFPQLHSLILRRLPHLKRFFPRTHSIHCPLLKRLLVSECDEIQIFASEFLEQEIDLSLFSWTKIIPNLEELALSRMNWATICQHQFPEDFFSKIKLLELCYFNDKSQVFPLDLLQKFPSIEKLQLVRSNFQELFPHERLVGKINDARTLANLQSLRLNMLHNLKNIWHRDSQSQLHQVFQTLETLEVFNCNSLINLGPVFASLKNLTTLKVRNCRAMVGLVTCSTAKSFVYLTKLSIKECNVMREIVSGDGDDDTKDEIIFIKLESIKLHCLPSLTSFSSGNQCFKFPSLAEVTVYQCPRLQVFSKAAVSNSDLQRVRLTPRKDMERWNGNLNSTIKQMFAGMDGFRGLQQLKLSEFPHLKDKWHGEIPAELFYELRSLVVDASVVSSTAIPSNLLMFLNNLEVLEVRNCQSLEGVFPVAGLSADQGHHGLLSQLESFYLIDLPSLMNIWSSIHQEVLNFKNLKSVKVQNCGNLKIIFTPSIAARLVQLQEMEVKNCTSLQEIVTDGDELAARDEIIFPALNSLVLEQLPNLTSFYSGLDVLDCPSIEKITAVDCPNIEVLTFMFPSENGSNTIDKRNEEALEKGSLDIHPVTIFFNGKVKCPSLKELKVEWNDKMKDIWNGESVTAECFSNLKDLELRRFPIETTVFPANFLERLPNLEKLALSDSCFEEIFEQDETVDVVKHSGKEIELHQLKLSKLSQLRYLIKDQPKPSLVIQNLETLEVSECGKLITLVPLLVTFQNLTSLEVSECQGLRNLVSSSTARSLVKLTRMSITDCEMVEEIVTSEADEAEDEMCFSQLKHLGLHCLPSLTRFYSGNCSFGFPSLEEVIVRECPKMEFFVQGDLSTPKLKSVQITEDEDVWSWDGNLNTTIQMIFSKLNPQSAEEHR